MRHRHAAVLVVISFLTHAQPLSLSGPTGTGREVSLEALRGQVIIVTIASQHTRAESDEVLAALEPAVTPGLQVVTAVDLVDVPTFFHAYAAKQVGETGRGRNVRFVVDYDGTWSRTLAANPAQRVDIVVVDELGEIRGRFVGKAEAVEALQLARRLQGAL